MRISFVKALRRTLAGLIAIILLAIGLNYVQIWRQRARLVKETTKILSTEMLRSADSIEYSENENGVARFKLHAEKLLETRQGKSLLQGIKANDYNPDGTVRNQIRSQVAEYDREKKKALFARDVHIQIGRDAELITDSLSYDLNKNDGSTDDRIRFRAPQATGTAKGVFYAHDQKILRLKSEVDFTLNRSLPATGGQARTEEVRVAAQAADYAEESGVIRFFGGASLTAPAAVLSGDEIEAAFSHDRKRLTSLICRGKAIYGTTDRDEARNLQGDLLTFFLNQQNGTLQRITAKGHASFSSGDSATSQVLSSNEINVDLDPDQGLPNSLLGQGSVEFRSKRDSNETKLSGEQLDAGFIPKTSALDNLQITGSAHMSTRSGKEDKPEDLHAEVIRFKFHNINARSLPKEIHSEKSVEWYSPPRAKSASSPARAGRSLKASSLNIYYASDGDQLESGNAAGGVTLSGIALENGAGSEIRKLMADEVQFHFFPKDNKIKDFDGNGNVRVFYSKPAAAKANVSSGNEFQTSSAKMHATFRDTDGTAESISQWGGFTYSDGVRSAASGRSDYDALKEILTLRESPRISDPSSTTTGDLIEYDRKGKILSAFHNVRSVIQAGKEAGTAKPIPNSGAASSSIVTAGEMRYWTEEAKARYSDNVQLLSESGQLQAKVLEVYNSGERVEAEGDVRHLISKRDPAGDAKQARAPVAKQSGDKPAAQDSPILINCSRMRFQRKENTIYYIGNVTLQSGDVWMSASSMEAFLNSEHSRIERAVARTNLLLRQGQREAQGDQGEYYLSPGKFIVTGNMARIKDPTRGTSLARRLTFFTADDRILLENH